MLLFFFFFKQKTAYEMRISDWSSDVCSSDLGCGPREKSCDDYFIHNCSILNLPMTGTYLKQLCAALVSSTPDKRGNWRIFITFELPMLSAVFRAPLRDRKSVVSGKRVSVRVDLGGRRSIKKKKTINTQKHKTLQ